MRHTAITATEHLNKPLDKRQSVGARRPWLLLLDTITTRFFILFLLFLFIPIASLIVFTMPLLQDALVKGSDEQLKSISLLAQGFLRDGTVQQQGAQLFWEASEKVPAKKTAAVKPVALGAAWLSQLKGALGLQQFGGKDLPLLIGIWIKPEGAEAGWLTSLNPDPVLHALAQQPAFYQTILTSSAPGPFTMVLNGGRYTLMQQVLTDRMHRETGRMILLLSCIREETVYHQYYQAVIWVSLLGVVLAMGLGMLAARKITAPMQQLIRQIETISQAGDWREKVSVSGVLEIHQLADVFNQLLQKLTVDAQLREDFMATLTHDLKVPLLAEKQSLLYLQRNHYGPLNSEQHELLTTLLSSNNEVLELVNGLLEVSRYESGQVRLKLETLDVGEVLSGSLQPLTGLIQEKQITLQLTPVSSPVLVCADLQELKRIFSNLLLNAIQNSGKHGQLTCTIYSPEAQQRFWETDRVSGLAYSTLAEPLSWMSYQVVSIQDSGVGIPKEALGTLFQRFSGNRGRNPMSMGLGLYNAYQVMQAFGGTLWVETTEGEGTVVCLAFPLNVIQRTQP